MPLFIVIICFNCRCKKVLVVISAESMESDLFHFQLRIAHSMSPSKYINVYIRQEGIANCHKF